ncbi:MAG: mannitol dehydrogenase family protein, partial [Planktomarina sp.]
RLPIYAIRSIASWHQFARHVAAGKVDFEYVEPSWDQLKSMLGQDTFVTCRQLWGDLPETYPEFANTLRAEIAEMELKWPV